MLAGRLGNVITSCRHQISNAAAKGLTSKIPARLRLSSDGPAATGTQSASRPSSTSNPVGYGFTHEDSGWTKFWERLNLRIGSRAGTP